MNNKVLCLLHLPPPYHGTATLNKNIVEGNLKEHFQIDIISINTSRRLEDIEYFSFTKIFTLLKISFVLLIKLLQNNYSLCYFSLTPTGIGFYKDLIFVLFIRVFRIKTLYHLHGKGISLKGNFLNDIFYRFCFGNSDVIIVSQLLFYDIEKYVNKKNTHILPNGIKNRLDNVEFESVINNRLNKNTLNLLFLSNMIKSKGVFIALEAAKILKLKGYNFKFHFVGEWYDINSDDFYSKVNQYNLVDIVEYLGFRGGEEKHKILKESDIFVYPTYKDIFGIVNIEAMQFGLPIVSTYEGAIPDIIDDGSTGFLVAKNDSRALAEKVEALINDAQLRVRMGRAGRKKFLRDYTSEVFQDRLLAIFNDALR